MTPEQAAGYLQLHTYDVYDFVRSHRLAAVKIGRTYRILREDLERFPMAHSTREEVREALFRRVLEFAERNNPDLS